MRGRVFNVLMTASKASKSFMLAALAVSKEKDVDINRKLFRIDAFYLDERESSSEDFDQRVLGDAHPRAPRGDQQ